MSTVFHLLYISEQSPIFTSLDMKVILEKSHHNNPKYGLTGILIKNGPFFIQLLEGKKESVLKTYDKISLDLRHTKVRTLMTTMDSLRIFPDWSMGFVEGSTEQLKMDELIPLIHEDIIKKEDTRARILSVLRKFNRR
jgi:hypothetical protein